MKLIDALWVVFITIGVCSLASMLLVLLGAALTFFQPLPDDSNKKPECKAADLLPAEGQDESNRA